MEARKLLEVLVGNKKWLQTKILYITMRHYGIKFSCRRSSKNYYMTECHHFQDVLVAMRNLSIRKRSVVEAKAKVARRKDANSPNSISKNILSENNTISPSQMKV